MRRLAICLLLTGGLVAFGCSSDKNDGDGAVSDGTSGDGTSGDGTVSDGTSGDGTSSVDGAATDAPASDGVANDTWGATNQPECNGEVKACADGKDNDEDGLIDNMDPECQGPCDDDEGSFATGIKGDNMDCKKQDCFFDGNSGGGDDGCEWDIYCDPAEPWKGLSGDKCFPPPCPEVEEGVYDCSEYKPNQGNGDCQTLANQTEECIENCFGYTPNGCDCFGCCEIWIDGDQYYIHLASKCSSDDIRRALATTKDVNDSGCGFCTQVADEDCLNDCGECEICMGKTVADLPAHCFPAVGDAGVGADAGGPVLPPPSSCPEGVPTCLLHTDCVYGYYCDTGCCKSELH